MASSSSTKILLISASVVSVAVTMKLTVPLMLNSLPAIWSVIVTCFKPPYLYVVINGIILTIAASTRFQHENQSQNQVNYSSPNAPSPADLASDLPPVSNPPSFGLTEPPPVSYDVEPRVTVETVAVSGSEVVGGNEDEFVTTRSTWNPSESDINSPPSDESLVYRKEVQPEFNFPVKEKELVTSRFANNRKPVKASPEGARALRVLKPKKHETLESTWKMITDGRQLPLTRHLRKSDTFDNLHHDSLSTTVKPKVVKKSETFKERTTLYADQNDYPQPSASNWSLTAVGKLKKDVSLGQDELNRRVEAFIKKFNDDMRLQRQESLKQYMEMVNRGTS